MRPPPAQVVPLAGERPRAANRGQGYCLCIPTHNPHELAREIAHTCGDCYVAIEAMVHKSAADDQSFATVIVITGPVGDEDTILGIVRRLETFSAVSGPIRCMRLESIAVPELARTAT